jgi:hypothetical protein
MRQFAGQKVVISQCIEFEHCRYDGSMRGEIWFMQPATSLDVTGKRRNFSSLFLASFSEVDRFIRGG